MRAANDNVRGASIRFIVEPRYVPSQKAARRLHLTEGEFTVQLPSLIDAGFPAPCPVTGHFDLKAIDIWMDRQSGLPASSLPVHDVAGLVGARLAALG